MTEIPKIIHQTWKTDPLPFPFSELAESWKTFLPDWEYILWTDEMNREFVAREYPDFLEAYDNYPKNIQRADAIRYLILKTYGGLYVDMDFECLENIEPLLKDAMFVAGKEPKKHSDRYRVEYIICNAFMASTPDNPFINFLCEQLYENAGREIKRPYDILVSTGPFLLTNAWHAFPDREKIRILEAADIYPIVLHEKDKILKDCIPEEMQERINRAYAMHFFWGNW